MKKLLIPIIVGILLFSFGCVSNNNQGSPNETKLEVTQGIGILKDQIKVDELFPGGEGFISFTLRDNLGGVTAKDVVVGLENLGPFKIIGCDGKEHKVTDPRTTCSGIWDMDKELTFGQHGTKFMIPGTEKTLWWRIKAPSSNDIGWITLSYPIYYYTEYTYWTTNAQTVAFMSQQELIRRKEAGENTEISGESKLSAGEIYVNFVTPQPIIYFYSQGTQSGYNFTAVYTVKNNGGGYAISDVLLVLDLPNGINYSSKSDMKDYGWHLVNDPDCKLTFFNESLKEQKMSCERALKLTLGNGFKQIQNDINRGKVIARVINRDDLSSEEYKVPCPLKITKSEMESMYNANVPLKFFTFQTFVIYRYYKEGTVNINVYPIRV